MMLVEYRELRKFHYLTYPAITPVITSGTVEKPNAMAASWVTPLSVNPPLFGVAISPKRYTYELIRRYGDFAVCFLPFSMVDKVLAVGSVSGKRIDKFSKYGLRIKKPKRINAPLIEQSISALECIVVRDVETGDHIFFVGKVVAAWVDKEVFKDRIFDVSKAKHVLYLGEGFFTTNSENMVSP